MKAIVLTKYGTPEDLEFREVTRPVPGDDEVSIKVHASAVNDWEWGLVQGNPLFIRLFTGLLRPKIRIPGCDVAGQVEAVGKHVTRFTPGDDVYGDLSGSRFGGFAEHVCAGQDAVARKPRNLTYQEAAAIPHAATLALQGLRDIAHISTGHTVLINGAGGGVGAIGIQLAKLHGGTEVTGVDSAEKLEYMRSIGFDHVIDYKLEDFTRAGVTYDVILDVKTNRSPSAYARALKPGGIYVTVGGSMTRVFQCLLSGGWIAKTRNRRLRVLGLKPNKGLDEITTLVEAGKVVPHIGEVCALRDVPQALRRFGEARHQGKIVIAMP